jgi:ABC-type multidrug transport system fused ATPase/permease subunit
MIKLTSATSKNYEAGQIHAVKGASHRLTWLIAELNHLVLLPVNLITCNILMYKLVGTSYLFGLTLLYICFYVDKKVNEMKHEIVFQRSKITQKKNNLQSEAFQNIRAIKLYGWDNFIKKEILDNLVQERSFNDQENTISRMTQVMWETLPRLITPMTFVIYMLTGNTMSFSVMMDVINMFGRIMRPLHSLNNI